MLSAAIALPHLINITEAATDDLKGHPRRIYPAGAIILEDWACVNYSLIRERCAADNHFVARCKETMRYELVKDRTIELLTNNFDRSAARVAERYKKRWDIALFFKSMNQNLQIKTFTGTPEHAVRSQIDVALICYRLPELLRRCTCKASHGVSDFVARIRICLSYYLSLDLCATASAGA